MKYIGVAVGQSITKTAKPLTALLAKDGVPDWEEMQQLITEWRPDILILGIPLNMNGTEQPITFAARKFGEKLKKRFTLPLEFVDERLSSWEAKNRIKERETLGIKKVNRTFKKDLKTLNATAAAVLVEQWLADK